MNIIYVQSYPVYHDMLDNEGFLNLVNRDKWMPSLTIRKGYPAQLWAAGTNTLQTEWQYDNLPTLPVQIFKSDQKNGNSRNHTSDALNRSALKTETDLFVLKGMDGGIGVHLAKQVLIPHNIPFAIIIGGEYYHSIVKHARAVLYETEWQRKKLTTRSIRFWRSAVDNKKLIRLSKSIDTRHFSPDPETDKEFDIIGMGRHISDFKDHKALFELSRHLKIAVIDDGPMLEAFRNKYPEITWIGPVSYPDLPSYLNKGKLFFHTGLRDHHPGSITKAAACGVPPVAFSEIIHKDVIPDHIGLRVSRKHFVSEITSLLEDQERLARMSSSARTFAEKHWNHLSSLSAITELLLLMHSFQNPQAERRTKT